MPLAALAGCRWGPPEVDAEPGPPPPEPDADVALLDEAAQAILGALDLVERVAARHRGLATALAGLVALHTAHLDLLGAEPGGPRPAVPPLPGARPALARVRADELVLQGRLAGMAAQAGSGAFARALASMSAAVAQHVAALPAVAGRGAA